ncbi:cytochrome P450 306a1 isoform X2 [Halyomorpha halys]|uniref:cytochrome P450 306a1 isoform X2 n=1 Tax=Halyomorpha halys TaxID=286706 RepID=UPI0006D4D94F|nr:cytochrome P450 306a1 isoform X2 [Halyomorpha halys]
MERRGHCEFVQMGCRETCTTLSMDLSEMLIASIVLLCATVFFYYMWRTRGMPPGPWGLPLVGYLPWIDKKKPYLSLMELYQDYGGICTIRLGEVVAIVVSEPHYVKEALSQEVLTGRAPLWLTHGLMNNNGLIAVEGPKWREQRKFAINCMKSLGAVKVGGRRAVMESRILEGVRQTFQMIDERRQNGPFDPKPILSHTIGNIMNCIVFGKSFSVDDQTWTWLQHMAEEGVKLVGVAGPLNFMPYLRILPQYRKLLEFIRSGQKRTHDVYRSIACDDNRTSDNILSYYLEAISACRGQYFDEAQMLHLLADMFGAGVDSTLATFRWVILYLALHPEVQECVYEEVSCVIGKDKEPNMDHLSQCPFTEATIMETMRIRPVVPLGIPHGATKDTQLAGFRVPEGTMIIVNQWTLHHDTKYWDDPEIFDPKRFISPEGTVKRKDSLNPFQTGKRSCFGEELAKMVLFLFTSSIVLRYRLDVEGPATIALEGECGITLCPGPQALTFNLRP